MPDFYAGDGTRLHYHEEGKGLPLLCLSGLTRNGRDFDFVAPHLSDVRLIRLDYRGRGQSAWSDPDTYTVETESADVMSLLDHLGLEKVAILGTSRGGLLAMHLAGFAVDRLLGVALNDVGPELQAEGLAHIAGYLGKPPPYPTLDDAARAQMADPAFPGVSFQRIRSMLSHVCEETPEGLRITYDPALYDAVFHPTQPPEPADWWALFDKLKSLPVALIRGKNSNLLAHDTAEKMAARHPGLIRAEVTDRGHTPFLDEPEALTALNDWLKDLK